MLALRDKSRRTDNPLLKPISELELEHFNFTEQVSPSYYRIPADFCMPVCGGRYLNQLAQDVMNEVYVSVTQGSENFKLRQKNPSEEALIKNEDDMYERDHDI